MSKLFSSVILLSFMVMFFFLAIAPLILERKEDMDEWNKEAPE